VKRVSRFALGGIKKLRKIAHSQAAAAAAALKKREAAPGSAASATLNLLTTLESAADG